MIDLIPRPKEIKEPGGVITGTDLVLTDKNKHPKLEQLLTESKTEILGIKPKPETDTAIPITVYKRASGVPAAVATVSKRSKEAYLLRVTNKGVQIYSRTYRGLVYGIHTLVAIAKVSRGKVTLPVCVIKDWPDFTMRGISDDIARCQVSTFDNFKRIIRELSRLKFNVLTFHMEDMIRFDKHPEIGKKYGALKKSEWQALVEYGKIYGLKLFPQFQMYGHAARVVMLPKYGKYGEYPTGTSQNYSSAAEGIYDLLDGFMTEINEAFGGDTIHIGCDEVQLSPKSGRSRHLVKKYGAAKVYIDHVLKVTRMAKKRWDTVIFACDKVSKSHGFENFGAGIRELEKLRAAGLTFLNWDYYKKSEMDYFGEIRYLNRCGVRQIIAPAIWDWRVLYPSYTHMEATLPPFLSIGYKEGIKETIVKSWNDTVDPIRENNYLHYAYTAEHVWNAGVQIETQEKFTALWVKQFFGSAPKALIDAYVWLGRLNPMCEDSARHDHRFPEEVGMLPHTAQSLFWNPPMVGSGTKEDALKSNQRSQEATQLLNAISTVTTKRNKNNIDLTTLGLKQGQWLFDSVQYSAKPTAARAKKLVEKLQEISTDFDRLWDMTNIYPGRQMVDRRFVKLIKIYAKESKSPSAWDGKWRPQKKMVKNLGEGLLHQF